MASTTIIRRFLSAACCLSACLALSACGTTELASSLYKQQNYYKVGNPYDGVDGRSYVPQEVAQYDATGMASWYGPGFHGKRTANGEPFDTNALTAAHRTLPLPSVIKVTNVENGRTALLKVNDRGPFSKDRLIDVSKSAAKALGFFGQGTAQVHVQYMPQESAIIAAAAKNGKVMDVDDAVQLAQSQPISAAPLEPVQVASLTPPPKQESEPIVISSKPDVPNPQNAAEPAHVELAAYTPPQPMAAPIQAKPVTAPSTSYIAAPAGRGYFVQAGSFANLNNAKHLTQKLQSIGRTEMLTSTQNGKTLYRVRIGPVKEQSQAQAIANKLGAYGVINPKVISD